MRISAVAVATLVLLAGATSALAVAETEAPRTHTDQPAAVGVQDDGNATEVQVSNLTIEILDLRGVQVEQARLENTTLQRQNDSVNPLGTATASNLSIENATLTNVTLRNVTIRNETVADALLGNQTPDGDTVAVENATLSNASIQSILVEESLIGSVAVGDVQASLSPGTTEANDSEQLTEPTIEVGNMTADDVLLNSVEAGGASVENASVGIGAVLGGGLGGDDTAGDATDGNATTTDTAARSAPIR